eukprot:TRINITY_DN2901_c0_g1_i1.p1 TRINITY_DN2901_c0_g1~~TRINITY_DN2901_c0_g1_i1.p1  ORF type:complete len:817 (-),score=169.03 TRINITY_DN2901_c0_g1_i1:117-2510(-)
MAMVMQPMSPGLGCPSLDYSPFVRDSMAQEAILSAASKEASQASQVAQPQHDSARPPRPRGLGSPTSRARSGRSASAGRSAGAPSGAPGLAALWEPPPSHSPPVPAPPPPPSLGQGVRRSSPSPSPRHPSAGREGAGGGVRAASPRASVRAQVIPPQADSFVPLPQQVGGGLAAMSVPKDEMHMTAIPWVHSFATGTPAVDSFVPSPALAARRSDCDREHPRGLNGELQWASGALLNSPAMGAGRRLETFDSRGVSPARAPSPGPAAFAMSPAGGVVPRASLSSPLCPAPVAAVAVGPAPASARMRSQPRQPQQHQQELRQPQQRQRSDQIDMREFLSRQCSERETSDLLDQHVQFFLRTWPDAARKHSVIRRRLGVYEIDGHEVWVEWQHMPKPAQGFLVVIDGPLRQPLSDYLDMTEANAFYDTGSVEKTTALHKLPREKRMTFDDLDQKYNRLEAMKVAKEQAKIREQAASFVQRGAAVPEQLVQNYNRTLWQKLGFFRSKPEEPEEIEESCSTTPTKSRLANEENSPATSPRAAPKQRQLMDENQDPAPNVANGGQLLQWKQPIPSPQVPRAAFGVVDGGCGGACGSPLAPSGARSGTPARALPPASAMPTLPPWAVLAPRGISLNGLPVGTAVPGPAFASVGGLAAFAAPNTSTPRPPAHVATGGASGSWAPAFAVSATTQAAARQPSSGRTVRLPLQPAGAPPPASPARPPRGASPARGACAVQRTWSGTNLPLPPQATPMAPAPPTSLGSNSSSGTPRAVAVPVSGASVGVGAGLPQAVAVPASRQPSLH